MLPALANPSCFPRSGPPAEGGGFGMEADGGFGMEADGGFGMEAGDGFGMMAGGSFEVKAGEGLRQRREVNRIFRPGPVRSAVSGAWRGIAGEW